MTDKIIDKENTVTMNNRQRMKIFLNLYIYIKKKRSIKGTKSVTNTHLSYLIKLIYFASELCIYFS